MIRFEEGGSEVRYPDISRAPSATHRHPEYFGARNLYAEGTYVLNIKPGGEKTLTVVSNSFIRFCFFARLNFSIVRSKINKSEEKVVEKGARRRRQQSWRVRLASLAQQTIVDPPRFHSFEHSGPILVRVLRRPLFSTGQQEK